jgi:GTPase SAR1 family protein
MPFVVTLKGFRIHPEFFTNAWRMKKLKNKVFRKKDCTFDNYISKMEEFMGHEDTTDLQNRKAIVIGSVGSGKTSLCRYVTGLYGKNADSKMSGHSVTKGVTPYKGRYLKVNKDDAATMAKKTQLTITTDTCPNTKVQFTMTDSEGYGADNFSRDNLKNQLLNTLKFETELNSILIVVSFERFRNGLKEDLDHLLGIIKTLGLAKEHTIVVFTHCELYSDLVKKSYYEEFKKYYNFDIEMDNVVFGCFPNVDEINDDFKPLIVEQVKKSITTLRAKLLARDKAVNVAMKISEIEKD